MINIGSSAIYMSSDGTGTAYLLEGPSATLSEFDFTPCKIYVLKYDHCRVNASTLQRISEELRKFVKFKECSFIAIPDTTDISKFTLDELTEIRDELTETINNMSYDNIIGF